MTGNLEYFGIPPIQKGLEYRLEEKITSATVGKVAFVMTYTVGMLDVYLNGLILPTTAYSATDGTNITLGTPTALNDVVKLISRSVAAVGLNNSYTQAQSDAKFATITSLSTKADLAKITRRSMIYFMGNF